MRCCLTVEATSFAVLPSPPPPPPPPPYPVAQSPTVPAEANRTLDVARNGSIADANATGALRRRLENAVGGCMAESPRPNGTQLITHTRMRATFTTLDPGLHGALVDAIGRSRSLTDAIAVTNAAGNRLYRCTPPWLAEVGRVALAAPPSQPPAPPAPPPRVLAGGLNLADYVNISNAASAALGKLITEGQGTIAAAVSAAAATAVAASAAGAAAGGAAGGRGPGGAVAAVQSAQRLGAYGRLGGPPADGSDVSGGWTSGRLGFGRGGGAGRRLQSQSGGSYSGSSSGASVDPISELLMDQLYDTFLTVLLFCACLVAFHYVLLLAWGLVVNRKYYKHKVARAAVCPEPVAAPSAANGGEQDGSARGAGAATAAAPGAAPTAATAPLLSERGTGAPPTAVPAALVLDAASAARVLRIQMKFRARLARRELVARRAELAERETLERASAMVQRMLRGKRSRAAFPRVIEEARRDKMARKIQAWWRLRKWRRVLLPALGSPGSRVCPFVSSPSLALASPPPSPPSDASGEYVGRLMRVSFAPSGRVAPAPTDDADATTPPRKEAAPSPRLPPAGVSKAMRRPRFRALPSILLFPSLEKYLLFTFSPGLVAVSVAIIGAQARARPWVSQPGTTSPRARASCVLQLDRPPSSRPTRPPAHPCAPTLAPSPVCPRCAQAGGQHECEAWSLALACMVLATIALFFLSEFLTLRRFLRMHGDACWQGAEKPQARREVDDPFLALMGRMRLCRPRLRGRGGFEAPEEDCAEPARTERALQRALCITLRWPWRCGTKDERAGDVLETLPMWTEDANSGKGIYFVYVQVLIQLVIAMLTGFLFAHPFNASSPGGLLNIVSLVALQLFMVLWVGSTTANDLGTAIDTLSGYIVELTATCLLVSANILADRAKGDEETLATSLELAIISSNLLIYSCFLPMVFTAYDSFLVPAVLMCWKSDLSYSETCCQMVTTAVMLPVTIASTFFGYGPSWNAGAALDLLGNTEGTLVGSSSQLVGEEEEEEEEEEGDDEGEEAGNEANEANEANEEETGVKDESAEDVAERERLAEEKKAEKTRLAEEKLQLRVALFATAKQAAIADPPPAAAPPSKAAAKRMKRMAFLARVRAKAVATVAVAVEEEEVEEGVPPTVWEMAWRRMLRAEPRRRAIEITVSKAKGASLGVVLRPGRRRAQLVVASVRRESACAGKLRAGDVIVRVNHLGENNAPLSGSANDAERVVGLLRDADELRMRVRRCL